MGVADELGLAEGLLSGSLVEAAEQWPRWVAMDPDLNPDLSGTGDRGGPGGVAELAGWLRLASPVEADRVLRALVRRGSPSGGDDRRAVAVATWVLLPGARALAHRLRSLSPRVDELVAAQLWVEVRTFPWQRLGKVAANVLANTRAHVLADLLPDREHGSRVAVRLVDPHSPWWEHHAGVGVGAGDLGRGAELDAAVEARVLLEDATHLGVVGRGDDRLLRVVLAQAEAVGGGVRRGRGGLLADRVVAGVVDETGLSAPTVRRRVRRTVVAIADAHRAGLIEAA